MYSRGSRRLLAKSSGSRTCLKLETCTSLVRQFLEVQRLSDASSLPGLRLWLRMNPASKQGELQLLQRKLDLESPAQAGPVASSTEFLYTSPKAKASPVEVVDRR